VNFGSKLLLIDRDNLRRASHHEQLAQISCFILDTVKKTFSMTLLRQHYIMV